MLTRILSLPFVLAMGLVSLVLGEGSALLLAMGAFYVGHVSIARVAGPLDDAFNIEVLDPRERATNTGFEIAVGGAMSAIAIVIASRMIDSGDFTTRFTMMAAALLISAVLYWQTFRPIEVASELERAADADELHTSPATGD